MWIRYILTQRRVCFKKCSINQLNFIIFFSSFIIITSLALSASSKSSTFECEYITEGWGTRHKYYYCDVRNLVNITSPESARNYQIVGEHVDGHNNDNLQAFSVRGRGKIYYFPKGLQNHFKNLEGIEIHGTGLKEICQEDIKDFSKLISLYLGWNELEVIEKDLFVHNSNLELIYLSHNKISRIDPSAFDMMMKLRYLDLSSNVCIDMDASDSQSEVQRVIMAVKIQCSDSLTKHVDVGDTKNPFMGRKRAFFGQSVLNF